MHLSGFPVCLSSVFTGESRAAQDEQTASRPLASVLLKGPLKAFCDSVSLSVTLPKEAGPPGAGALGPRGGAGGIAGGTRWPGLLYPSPGILIRPQEAASWSFLSSGKQGAGL